jgi:heme O synthase-like polyprenyltransferase
LATATYSVAFTSGASFLTMVKDMAWMIFPISILSFVVLLILYYLFLDREMNLRIALILGVLLAAASVMAPYAGIVYIKNEDTPGIILSFSVFFTWQTSFGWVLHYSKKENGNEK